MYSFRKNLQQGEQHSQSSRRPYQGSRSFGDGSCPYGTMDGRFVKVAVIFHKAEANLKKVAADMEHAAESLEKVAGNMEKRVDSFGQADDNPETTKNLLHQVDHTPAKEADNFQQGTGPFYKTACKPRLLGRCGKRPGTIINLNKQDPKYMNRP